MSTRSLTVFKENWEFEGKKESKKIVAMYRHSDGYPSGHGKDLAEFLKDMVIVSGISFTENRKIANGMGCLAAQVVSNFKSGVGSIYLYPPKSKDVGEEYIYTIENQIVTNPKLDNFPIITIYDVYDKKKLFKGTAEDLLESGIV